MGSIKCQCLSPGFLGASLLLKKVKHSFRKINCETLIHVQTKYFNLWVSTQESRQRADFYASHNLYLKTISHTKEQKQMLEIWPDFHPFTKLKDKWIFLMAVTLTDFLILTFRVSSSFHPEIILWTFLVHLLTSRQGLSVEDVFIYSSDQLSTCKNIARKQRHLKRATRPSALPYSLLNCFVYLRTTNLKIPVTTFSLSLYSQFYFFFSHVLLWSTDTVEVFKI